MKIYVKKRPLDYIVYSAIIILGVIVDQISKFLIISNMELRTEPPFDTIPIIKNFFHITFTTNDGMAFGMMDGPKERWIFLIVSTLAILAFGVYLYLGHADNLLYGTALAMVVSGGIGNMIDRLGFGFYVNPETGLGEVIDFIDFCGIWNAIFNIADSFVCVGAGLLVLALIIDIIKDTKKKHEESATEALSDGEDTEVADSAESGNPEECEAPENEDGKEE